MSCTCDCKCGCCTGTNVITPEPIYNRPGLDEIQYRIGEHGSFYETMLARLSSKDFPALTGLTVRTPDDPSIALLDIWAVAADVLTFYQERIANEGYLRTATERRSVLELARLIGYMPRPGVSASVYLAYTVDSNATEPVELPEGSRAQSVPGPGEMPQSFETSEKFVARKEWNAIKPRLRRPQTVLNIIEGSDDKPGPGIYLKGTNLNLKVNDALLLSFGVWTPKPFRISGVEENAADGYTYAQLSGWLSSDPLHASAPTQFRRAVQSYDASLADIAGSASVAVEFLEAGREFLSWFYEQSLSQTVPPDVSKVLDNLDLVAAIVQTFERLRETAVLALPDSALVALSPGLVRSIKSLLIRINELIEGPSSGTIEAQGALVIDALMGAKAGGDSIDAQQDKRLITLTRNVVRKLALPPSVPLRDSQSLERSPGVLFDTQSDVGARLVGAMQPSVADALTQATRNLKAAPSTMIHAFVLRQKALLFGATAPKKVTSVSANTGVAQMEEWSDADVLSAEEMDAVHLDAAYEKVKPGSWVMLDFSGLRGASIGSLKPASELLVAQAGTVDAKIARSEYNFSGQTTRLGLVNPSGATQQWFDQTAVSGGGTVGATPSPAPGFALIRRTAAYFDSEELTLADEVITTKICGGDQWIETDGLVTGLQSGRWLMVSGERADIEATSGVNAGELVMLEAVRQYVEKQLPQDGVASESGMALSGFLPGDSIHTYLKLARPLAYCYKRDTAAINANVVKATNGETRNEVLGAGDSSLRMQTFALRQPPLTFVASPDPSGAKSTLKVYVNDVEWHEADALIDLGPNEHGFVTGTDDNSGTSVIFGNGITGALVPTGIENIKAIYRNGIGIGGNVKAGQISQLMSRPLGIKAVINPLGASGGADRETRDQARRNAPLAVRSLDRLVSTEDYADFAHTFAGIGKAVSARLEWNGVETVFMTIAGAGDIPIDKTSDLYANLVAALREFGDPYQPFRVETRELLLLAMSARLAINPDYIWSDVVDWVRASLLDRFSFERRNLGQSVALSELIASIQSVQGVAWVDVDALGAVSQIASDGQLRSPQEVSVEVRKIFDKASATGRPSPLVRVRGIHRKGKVIAPAQVAFFVPEAPETIILNKVEV
jgi:hypothetical protein